VGHAVPAYGLSRPAFRTCGSNLVDALHMRAGVAILHDPGVRTYYDELRTRQIGHNAALRQVGNRLVGILHGCLKTTTHYNQTTAWSHRTQPAAA
jgi:hypothetical protein